jgi:hypothetical protein
VKAPGAKPSASLASLTHAHQSPRRRPSCTSTPGAVIAQRAGNGLDQVRQQLRPELLEPIEPDLLTYLRMERITLDQRRPVDHVARMRDVGNRG